MFEILNADAPAVWLFAPMSNAGIHKRVTDVRLRADSWDAGKWTMLERQCEPHPADYAPRGPASMRISSTVDPVSQDVIA